MNPLLTSNGLARRAFTAVADKVHARIVAGDYEFNGEQSERVAFITYFSSGPVDAYQLQQWLAPLERLAGAIGPGVIILSNPRTAALLREQTSLDIVLTSRANDVDTFIAEHSVQLVFYVNNNQANFTVLRNNGPTHIHLSHGESEKSSMVSNQLKAYDFAFIAGRAARDRIQAQISRMSDEHLVEIGRPQLDHVATAQFPPTPRYRILYAPTWEGDGPSMAYGSLDSVGLKIVDAILEAPDMQLVFRPHPRSGTHSEAYAAALKTVRQKIDRANRNASTIHVIDHGMEATSSINAADVVISDVSAMAMDAVGLRIPLVLTPAPASNPHSPGKSLLRDAVPTLDSSTTSGISEIARELACAEPPISQNTLADYVFGPCPTGGYTKRFLEAVTAVMD